MCALTVILNLVRWVHSCAGKRTRGLAPRADAAAATVSPDAKRHRSVVEPPNDAALDAGIWVYEGTRAIQRPVSEPPDDECGAPTHRAAAQQFANVGGGSPVRFLRPADQESAAPRSAPS